MIGEAAVRAAQAVGYCNAGEVCVCVSACVCVCVCMCVFVAVRTPPLTPPPLKGLCPREEGTA